MPSMNIGYSKRRSNFFFKVVKCSTMMDGDGLFLDREIEWDFSDVALEDLVGRYGLTPAYCMLD